MELKCIKCGESYKLDSGFYQCPKCEGQLKFLNSNPKFIHEKNRSGIWKYFKELPLINEENIISLGEGSTPLIKCDREKEYQIWLKNETINPTGTYKDRPASVGVSKAKELKADGVIVASDGNAAPAVAAYAARGNLKAVVLMPEATPSINYLQTAALGAKVILVEGSINDCIDLAAEISNKGDLHNCSTTISVNPYQVEGNKTIVFEILYQEKLDLDYIAVPVGGAGLLIGTARGILELEKFNLLNKTPGIIAVQTAVCSPFVRAFKEKSAIRKWEAEFKTKATKIALPYPPDGEIALEYLNKLDGRAVAVTEAEIIEAAGELAAGYGVLAEPSGAVSYAGLKKAYRNKIIDKNSKSLAFITGSGLKTIQDFKELDNEIFHVKNDYQEIIGCI